MNQIKVLREKQNISQAEVARRLEISQQAISKWESGEADPRSDKLLPLAAILGCSVEELLSGTEKKEA